MLGLHHPTIIPTSWSVQEHFLSQVLGCKWWCIPFYRISRWPHLTRFKILVSSTIKFQLLIFNVLLTDKSWIAVQKPLTSTWLYVGVNFHFQRWSFWSPSGWFSTWPHCSGPYQPNLLSGTFVNMRYYMLIMMNQFQKIPLVSSTSEMHIKIVFLESFDMVEHEGWWAIFKFCSLSVLVNCDYSVCLYNLNYFSSVGPKFDGLSAGPKLIYKWLSFGMCVFSIWLLQYLPCDSQASQDISSLKTIAGETGKRLTSLASTLINDLQDRILWMNVVHEVKFMHV